MELKVDNLTFAYHKGQNVLIDASARFEPGVHLVLGPNGAGKSTLLKIIDGQLRPQQGECVLGKEATAFHSPHAVREMFLLTDNCRFPLATIGDMARYHAPFYSSFSQEFLTEALDAFGISANERLKDMSLGTLKKAQIAYVLALGTKVLMLDEPANGLDISSKKVLTTLIGRAMDMDPERRIIIATHTVQEMRNLFDGVTILNHGRVVLNASTALISERLAFINERQPHADALCYESSIDGPCQVVPNDGNIETPIDFTLLYLAAVGQKSDILHNLLNTDLS